MSNVDDSYRPVELHIQLVLTLGLPQVSDNDHDHDADHNDADHDVDGHDDDGHDDDANDDDGGDDADNHPIAVGCRDGRLLVGCHRIFKWDPVTCHNTLF